MADQQSSLKYSEEHTLNTSLVSEWESGEQPATKLRRDLRRFDVNVQEKRAAKEISADETYIPIRSIDASIRREKPPLLAYLQQSRRLLLFQDALNPDVHAEDLEIAFSRWMRYEGWDIPWTQAIDAVCLHGGVTLEVRFDPNKPLQCAIEYIPREDLIFPKGTKGSLQACERIVRRFEYYPWQLEHFVESMGFDKAQVDLLTRDKKESQRNDLVTVWRVFRKKDNIIWVYWDSDKCSSYLRPPLALFNGMGSPEEEYPLFFFPTEVIEDETLLNVKGCAQRFLPDQEAQTALWTSMVNGTTRASHVYASLKNQATGELNTVSETSELKPDVILGREVDFWNYPYPDPITLQVAQGLAVEKQSETGQVNFAVSNRKDSRKTAEEIRAAQAQQSLISSVPTAALATVILRVYSACWRIAQFNIAIGNIQGFPVPMDRVQKPYLLSPAGDVDWIQRQEKKALVKEFLQLSQGSSLQNVLFRFAIQLFFPEEATQFLAALNAPDSNGLIQALASALASAPREQLSPEDNANLDRLLAAAQQFVTGPGALQPGA